MNSIKIDPETISEINIKDRTKKVKVYLSDCSGRTKEIDWIFKKDQRGIDKAEKVIKAFEEVLKMLKE